MGRAIQCHDCITGYYEGGMGQASTVSRKYRKITTKGVWVGLYRCHDVIPLVTIKGVWVGL